MMPESCYEGYGLLMLLIPRFWKTFKSIGDPDLTPLLNIPGVKMLTQCLTKAIAELQIFIHCQPKMDLLIWLIN